MLQTRNLPPSVSEQNKSQQGGAASRSEAERAVQRPKPGSRAKGNQFGERNIASSADTPIGWRIKPTPVRGFKQFAECLFCGLRVAAGQIFVDPPIAHSDDPPPAVPDRKRANPSVADNAAVEQGRAREHS